jgi:hypothetical protein
MKRMVSAGMSSRRSGTSSKPGTPGQRRFVVGVRSAGGGASLEQSTIHVVLTDPAAEQDEQLRVIDESGEDCLFCADCFVAIQVPAAVRASLLRAS